MKYCLALALSFLLFGYTSLLAYDKDWNQVYPGINYKESSCPNGWIPVPLTPTSSPFFCVMTGKAKAWVDRVTQDRKLNGLVDKDEILISGCDEVSRRSSASPDWALDENIKPVSAQEGKPWRAIGYDDAVHK